MSKNEFLIKANQYKLALTEEQAKTVKSWAEKEAWLYNYFIQRRQYKESLKKSENPSHIILHELEEKKGFPKTERGQKKFTWKTYWSCVYKEAKINWPDLADLPSTLIENSGGAIDKLNKAYDMLRKSNMDIIKGKKKKSRKKNILWHPSDKFLRDGSSFAVSVGLTEKEIEKGLAPDCKVLFGNGVNARVIGFPLIAKGAIPGSKVKKSLKFHYPRDYRLPENAIISQLRILVKEDQFWLSIVFKTQKQENIKNRLSPVGIDIGTDSMESKNFCTLSDGKMVSNHSYPSYGSIRNLEKKKKRMQKMLRRKVGGDRSKRQKQSKNYKRAYAAVAKIDAKIANIRKYHSKMIATELNRDYSGFYMEDLSISNMTRSAKGTDDKPGKNVKAKAGLNRAILNVAPYAFKQNMINKSKEYGNEILHVNPRFTSQKCNSCGHTERGNRKGIRFVCLKCSHTDHADINAAKNIRDLGLDYARDVRA